MPSSRRHRHRPDLSLLVPFHEDHDQEHRTRVWKWLEHFWRCQLPEAEIVIGEYNQLPFSKARAVNEAAENASGRVFTILDADCFMDPQVLDGCTWSILKAQEEDRRLWFVPYRNLWRLNEKATRYILESDPCAPYNFPSPPPPKDLDPHQPGSEGYGHRFGAMVMIMPAEAFWKVGGFDFRFAGWGAEDSAILKSLDTLWSLHENTPNDMLHMWHQHLGDIDDHASRRWTGQKTGNLNARLGQRYDLASADPTFMQALVNERN